MSNTANNAGSTMENERTARRDDFSDSHQWIGSEGWTSGEYGEPESPQDWIAEAINVDRVNREDAGERGGNSRYVVLEGATIVAEDVVYW